MICGAVGSIFICGYATYIILNDKDNAFIFGFLLRLIGVIIAVCIKKHNNKKVNTTNKYDDLEKLQRLKENETITEAEFKIEKERLLK